MDPAALAALRRSYELAGLDTEDVNRDPLVQFQRWLADAVAAEFREPNAMVLATADSSGQPRARSLLLKGVTSEGFTFFTNYESTKAKHLEQNPRASLCFPWWDLERQVIVEGHVSRTSRELSGEYFRSRPHGSRLGALASPQSRVVESRDVLTERFAELGEQYPEGDEVPLPDHWGGYVLAPTIIEFWQGRSNRMHDRVRYRRATPTDQWVIERLAP
jgi:pyridoxamine 5'-phosphate oxidase